MARRENGHGNGHAPEHIECRCRQCAALKREVLDACKVVGLGLATRGQQQSRDLLELCQQTVELLKQSAQQSRDLRARLEHVTSRACEAEDLLQDAEALLDDAGLGELLGVRLAGLDAIKAVFAEHLHTLYPHEVGELSQLVDEAVARYGAARALSPSPMRAA